MALCTFVEPLRDSRRFQCRTKGDCAVSLKLKRSGRTHAPVRSGHCEETLVYDSGSRAWRNTTFSKNMLRNRHLKMMLQVCIKAFERDMPTLHAA